MKNIYLVGFMGTGKTAVGKVLSEELNKEFVEMDEVIEGRAGKKIVDIFASFGEPYFRDLEKKLLKEISLRSGLIVSCGGGLICGDENANILKSTGIVINLMASAKTIYSRIKHNSQRPLLNVDDPVKKIEELIKKRGSYYAKAHYTVDTDNMTPYEIADKIIEIINLRENA